MTDAYPRARLAFSQLLGLAVSRYVLVQEPLASADHETIAAWARPSLDYFLHGELGGSSTSVGAESRPPSTAQHVVRAVLEARSLENTFARLGGETRRDFGWRCTKVARAMGTLLSDCFPSAPASPQG